MPDCRNIAAIIHADMVEDDRNGYSWEPRWGGDHPDGYKELEIEGRKYGYWLGSYDCSSSVITAWSQALRYTAYEGVLDDAYYTGNMREVFERSGLFYTEDSANHRGDIYLNDGSHTALCQDGGDDGVYGYDCMSQFSINEHGEVYGGYVGDQTGYEAYMTYYHDHPWDANLHYNGLADGAVPAPEPPRIPEQNPGTPYNDLGMTYRAHVENAGWMAPVHDGQTAGSVGYGARMEAFKCTPPKGVGIDFLFHLQDKGDVWYRGVQQGVYDPVMGTEGESRRIEGICASVKRLPKELAGCVLYYRVHMSDIGWTPWVREGTFCGTRGQGRQVEAIEMRLQSEQDVSEPLGVGGTIYQTHVEGFGWLPIVHDGMTAGTTGQSRRCEAVRILDVPNGAKLDAIAHIQDLGDVRSDGIKRGVVATLGTTGEGKRLEAITITERENTTGKKLCYQCHEQDVGWTKVCHSGEMCGSVGKGKRLEAFRLWFE